MSALVGCLGFADSAVQASAVEALGMLACDSAARAQVRCAKHLFTKLGFEAEL